MGLIVRSDLARMTLRLYCMNLGPMQSPPSQDRAHRIQGPTVPAECERFTGWS